MYLRSWLVLPLKEIVKEEVKVGNDLLLEMGGRLRMERTAKAEGGDVRLVVAASHTIV